MNDLFSTLVTTKMPTMILDQKLPIVTAIPLCKPSYYF